MVHRDAEFLDLSIEKAFQILRVMPARIVMPSVTRVVVLEGSVEIRHLDLLLQTD